MDYSNRSIIAVFIGVVGFSMKSIFIKFSYSSQLDLITIMSLRMLFSLPFFVLAYLCFTRHRNRSENKSNKKLIFTCSLFYFISSISNIAGLQYVSVTTERIILFLIPIFVLILSKTFMKKNYSKKVYFLSLISWLGVVIAFVGGNYSNGVNERDSLVGGGLIFISALSYAAYFMLSDKEMKNNGVMKFNAQVMILACIYSIILMGLSGKKSVVHLYSLSNMLYPFMLAFFSTVIPSFLMMYGIKHCGPEKTAVMNNIGPFITIIIGYITLNETISMLDILGMMIVMFCIISINKINLQKKRAV